MKCRFMRISRTISMPWVPLGVTSRKKRRNFIKINPAGTPGTLKSHGYPGGRKVPWIPLSLNDRQ